MWRWQVIERGTRALKWPSRLGEEQWNVREQVFLACLDDYARNEQLAQRCLDELVAKFGRTSARVSLLQGQLHECKGDFTKAEEIYKKILEQTPNHIVRPSRGCYRTDLCL